MAYVTKYLNRHLLMTHLPAQACKHSTSALPLLSPLIMVVGTAALVLSANQMSCADEGSSCQWPPHSSSAWKTGREWPSSTTLT